jgi:hypothetical protein
MVTVGNLLNQQDQVHFERKWSWSSVNAGRVWVGADRSAHCPISWNGNGHRQQVRFSHLSR